MSWSTWHRESAEAAEQAHAALRRGEVDDAKRLFEAAARSEARALDSVGSDKPRTLGITAVSAVALWYKAGRLQEAADLAHQASATPHMPAFAITELRELLQSIWNEEAQAAAGVSFVPGQVIVSVKGGEVVTGGAPLDMILDKVQTIQSLFFRTAEYLKSVPLRKKGPPPKDLQERCRPWLFQSVPGSYQFAVAIQKPPQGEMFPDRDLEPEVLTETFLTILKAAGEDPAGALLTVVTTADYRETFLKLTRNLAPTGKRFSELEIRGAGDRQPVVLSSESRRTISESLRSARPPVPIAGEEEVSLQGVLRALDLEHDWLEVSVDGAIIRVTGVGDTVDDLIGPMVNRETVVRARRKNNKHTFIDIELYEQ
jgi:hypothetical protein